MQKQSRWKMKLEGKIEIKVYCSGDEFWTNHYKDCHRDYALVIYQNDMPYHIIKINNMTHIMAEMIYDGFEMIYNKTEDLQ